MVSGALAVMRLNRGATGADITLRSSDVGLLDTPKLARNLWKGEDVADFTVSLTQRIQPHETILLKITG